MFLKTSLWDAPCGISACSIDCFTSHLIHKYIEICDDSLVFNISVVCQIRIGTKVSINTFYLNIYVQVTTLLYGIRDTAMNELKFT